MKKQLFEIALISAIITENYSENVRNNLNLGAIAALEFIAHSAITIFKKNQAKIVDKTFDWDKYCTKKGLSDYEEFILEEFKKLINKEPF